MLCSGIEQNDSASFSRGYVGSAALVQKLKVTSLVVIWIGKLQNKAELAHQLDALVHKIVGQAFRTITDALRFVLRGQTRVVVPAVELTGAVLRVLHRLPVDVP